MTEGGVGCQPVFDDLCGMILSRKLHASWAQVAPAILAKTSKCGSVPVGECRAIDCSALAVSAGNIFNADELALELTGNSRAFKDQDELLTAAYRRWDEKLFSRLNGAFSAALWDRHKNRLILFTDRHADGNIYYRFNDNKFVFSSSLSLLVDAANQIDRQAVKEFLRFLYVAAPKTIYSGVARLEPGYFLVVEDGKVSLRAMPEPMPSWKATNLSKRGANEVLDIFEALLIDSVQRRVSERSVGMLLSSGIDSATLATLCKSTAASTVAFTVSFGDAASDETERARELAQHAGVTHERVSFQCSDYQHAFDQMVGGFDQPIGDPASLPLLLTCGAVVGRAEVLIDGTGADGLFSTSIPRHIRFGLEVAAKLPRSVRQAAAKATVGLSRLRMWEVGSLFDFDDPEDLIVTWRGWKRAELEILFGENVDLNDSAFYRSVRSARNSGGQAIYDAVAVYPTDDCRLASATLWELPICFPYHDTQLEEFVRSLPCSWRYQGNESKVLLRRLYEKYYPERVWQVQKKYFNFPLQGFLSHDRFKIVREHLAPRRIGDVGLVDVERVTPWIDRYLAGDQSLMFKIWGLLVLHAWFESRN